MFFYKDMTKMDESKSAKTVTGMVLDSRALFGHPNTKGPPFWTPKKLCEEFLRMSISSI